MEAYTETILKRNALSKLRLAERRLNGIENIITEAETSFLENDRKNQTIVMENIASQVSILQHQEEDFSSGLKNNLKELTQKQDYMNRYLPKRKHSILLLRAVLRIIEYIPFKRLFKATS